jgi:hypothetical protein
MKFKGFCLVFIFNLNVVFTMHFFKMALSRVRFCPGFPPGAGFLESNLLHRVSNYRWST